MRRLLLVALATLSLSACGSTRTPDATAGGEADPGRSGIFERFEHAEHDASLQAAGWSCDDCHLVGSQPVGAEEPLGVSLSVEEDRTLLTPPERVCHVCHDLALGGVDAPTRCLSCHPSDGVEAPVDHAAGWEASHARAALLRPDECDACHEPWTCVTCHVRRGQLDGDVHPGNFRTLHGIAATSDPISCEECHEGSSCRACHASATGTPSW